MIELLLIPLGLYLGFNFWDRKSLLSKSSDVNAELTQPLRTSLVICAYNEENYIGRTLDSLFDQNIIKAYPEYFEIIVVDNGSTDNTSVIAGQYPVRLIQEPRRGKLYARDIGTKAAQGDIIVSCDADAFYPTNYVNLILSIFNENPNIAGVCGIFILDKFGTLTRSKSFAVEMPYMFGSASAFKKEYYSGFDFNIDQFSLKEIANEEEKNFAVRLSQSGDIIKTMDAVVIVSDRRFTPFLIDNKFQSEITNKTRFGRFFR